MTDAPTDWRQRLGARDGQIAAYLDQHGYADWQRHDLGGDASTRRYERLTNNGETLILMDAPPRAETPICTSGMTPAERVALGYNAVARLSAGRVDAFVAVNAYLRTQGLAAPDIHAFDAGQGLAVLQDFGTGQYFDLLENGTGAPERVMYRAAIDALVRLHQATPPDVLTAVGASWPLLNFDPTLVSAEVSVFLDWYMPHVGGQTVALDAADDLRGRFTGLLQPLEAQQDVLAIRDFHSPNLMWRPDRTGLAQVGILDHQDALRGHKAYDLVSLLQDARRRVAPELEVEMLDYYLAASGHPDPQALCAAYAVWGAERATRIVGLWPRLKHRDGKPHYMAFMPHTQAYLRRNLAHAACAPLRDWFARHVPDILHD